MVLLDTGVTVLRDAMSSDFSSGQAGTGTFPTFETQTSLFTPVATTLNTLSTNIKSKNIITLTHVVTIAEANGSTLAEWEILGNSDGTDYNRIVLSGLVKSSTTEITMIQVFSITRI